MPEWIGPTLDTWKRTDEFITHLVVAFIDTVSKKSITPRNIQ